MTDESSTSASPPDESPADDGGALDGSGVVAKSYPSIQEEFAAIFADVPQEEWDKLPADLIENLDHYLYVTPKK